MRKLLINSSALATVAGLTLSASVVLADVSIKATSELSYFSRESLITTSKGDWTAQASEIIFNFSNKTDSGLTVGYTAELTSNAAAVAIDESFITISGGFGKVVLGESDDAADSYAVAAGDVIAEETYSGSPDSATVGTSADMLLNNDNAKIAYHIPAMGGFKAGVSFEDGSASATASTETDTTSYGASYGMEMDGTAIIIGMGSTSQETAAVASPNLESKNYGVKIVRGNISAAFAKGTYDALDEDRSMEGIGASYNMQNGFILGAYKTSASDADDPLESYDNMGFEVQYTIATGLTAVVNYENFDYDAGTSDETTSDDGNLTKVTIKAAF